MSKTISLEVSIIIRFNFDINCLEEERPGKYEDIKTRISDIINQITKLTIYSRVYQVIVKEILRINEIEVAFIVDLKYDGDSPVKRGNEYISHPDVMLDELVHNIGYKREVKFTALSYIMV